MIREDLENWELAEDIYNFVGLPDVFDDFCRRCATEDLSLAEYVSRYKFEDFRKWYEDLNRSSVSP